MRCVILTPHFEQLTSAKISDVYFHLYASIIKGRCLCSFFLSSTDHTIQNFSTILYVLLYMALLIWDIFTWLSVTFVHDIHLQMFLQINTVVQYDTALARLLTHTCTHLCVCLPSVTHSVWQQLSHTPAPTGSSCELVPINKPASLFPVLGDAIRGTLSVLQKWT